MQDIETKGITLKYSSPDPQTNIINVIRLLPDKTEVIVGKLYQEIDDNDIASYLPVDNTGEELMPATSEFSTIERRYTQLINEEKQRLFMEEMVAEADEQEERESLLKKIRNWKIKSPKLLNR